MADNNKTEKATEKKRRDERKKGNIFQSKDVVNAFGLLILIFILKIFFSPMLNFIQSNIKSGIGSLNSITELTPKTALGLLTDIIVKSLIIIVPFGAVASLIAIVLTGAQTRFLFNIKKLKPDFSRVNPVSGFQKMFSIRSVVELLKSLIKVTLILIVVYTNIKSLLPSVTKTPTMSLSNALAWIGDSVYDIAITIAMYMCIFAAADYFYQWWQYEKEIRMTKQEIKDEFKQTEGDPHIKGKIKEVQRRMANMRMMRQVPEADVVVRNPTHYAVALKYKPGKDRAPIVVAKGKDLIALKIIEIAEEHGVELVENKPLARGLYEAVELDRAIPEEFYKPVADILAYIYKLKNKKVTRR
jgi:flagellar biosynthetic protein FlhB